MPRRPQPLRIAIDTGGTFTDCVWIDAGRLRTLKVFSTPADPSQAIVEAIQKIAHESAVILLHGTTVGTNTLLERKGARTALVTTAGFEDVIEIGRQARPKLYDFFFDRVESLVPKELRFGINERTACDGRILNGPTRDELRELASKLAAAKPQSVAISLLFCFANPKNEQSVAEALNRTCVPLSISHRILPEFREYERLSTVVINAYLQPRMTHYLDTLERHLEGEPKLNGSRRVRTSVAMHVTGASSESLERATLGTQGSRSQQSAKLFVMQSSGGITTAARALLGKCCSRCGAANSSRATASAPTTPVSWVLAPAASATGVRDELLLIGKP